jgi:hypothetical protein
VIGIGVWCRGIGLASGEPGVKWWLGLRGARGAPRRSGCSAADLVGGKLENVGIQVPPLVPARADPPGLQAERAS